MKKGFKILPVVTLAVVLTAYVLCWIVDETLASPQTESRQRDLQSAKDPASLDARKKLLDEREAALAAREQKVEALASEVTARSAELENVKKSMAGTIEEHKKMSVERARKTLKIYRSLRAEESAKLLDRLDEATAASILNALDQKTVAQLIPYLNQGRVLKWTRETLSGKLPEKER